MLNQLVFENTLHLSTSLFPLFEMLNRSLWVYILLCPMLMSWVRSKPEIQAVVGWEAPRSCCAELTREPDFLSQYTPGHYLPLLYVVKRYLGSTWDIAPFRNQPYWYILQYFLKKNNASQEKQSDLKAFMIFWLKACAFVLVWFFFLSLPNPWLLYLQEFHSKALSNHSFFCPSLSRTLQKFFSSWWYFRRLTLKSM